ncbi:MAG: hypothetical protein J5486_01800 [Bacteroidaceae bacterium]|nr:hypothetical protein [Bacteroidaceae bacterium]
MKNNIIKTFFVAFAVALGMTSCEDMLTPELDRHNEIDNIATDTLYSYWGVLKSLQNVAERYVILGECRGDLVDGTDYVSDSIHAILTFGLEGNVSDGACRYLRAADYYHVINSCNAFIAHCDTSMRNGLNDPIMLKEYAQVASIRAWVYLQLVLTYGEVPYFDTPMLSTEAIEDFRASGDVINIDNITSKYAIQLLEQERVRMAEYPNYGKYGYVSTIARALQCVFPQNLVLGDIYLLHARQGQTADYAQAAKYYYDFLNSEYGGVINPQNYYTLLYRNRREQLALSFSGILWGQMFYSVATPSASTEKVTVIPSSNNKLWGNVLRGVNDLFGYSTSIAVGNAQLNDTTTATVASISLTENYQHELGRSKNYVAISDEQVYESYIGPEASSAPLQQITGGSDARIRMATVDNLDEETSVDYVNFVIKQNIGGISQMMGGTATPYAGFCTSYPIIYRKASIWLRFAEAINGAGFPGYAFAILKSGLCGNSVWVPSSTADYAPKSYNYYDITEIVPNADPSLPADTTWYNSESELTAHLVARATSDGAFTTDYDSDPETYESEYKTWFAAHADEIGRKTVEWYEWPDETNMTLVCNHIAMREMKANAPYLNFNTEYLRGSFYVMEYSYGVTEYTMSDRKTYPTTSSTSFPVTMGIHNRGCGLVKYDERNTWFNYENQINRMLAKYEGVTTPLTREEIYDEANLAKIQTAIADLILDELALETSFEGNRFFDLVCRARFSGSNDELAKRVAGRSGTMDGSLRTHLQTASNWYFKLP